MQGKLGALAGVLLVVFAPLPVRANQSGEVYEYTVLRNGTPIGYHLVKAVQDGNQLQFEVETDLEVKFGFFPLFRFKHERRELWRDGRLIEAVGKTNNDGEQFDISVRAEGGQYVREVNGRREVLDGGLQPLVYWNRGALRHNAFFSVVEDKVLNVDFQYGGRYVVDWGDRPEALQYYKMVGDEERELWYDDADRLVRVKFRRLGSDIDFVLNDQRPILANGPESASLGQD